MNAHRHVPGTGRRAGALLLALLVTAFQSSPAQDPPAPAVSRGDTVAEVVARLGRPRGAIERKNRISYTYDRGMVHFVDGRVVSAFLVTPEEAEQRRLAQERATEAARRQTELQRERLTAEGRIELRKQQDDPAFNARPAAERVAYWENFQRRYPFTDVNSNLATARAAVGLETGRQTKDEESKTLLARLEAIRARRVELDAAFASSLANWKRNEITAERTRLNAEEADCLRRMAERRDTATTGTTAAAAAGQ